MAVVPFWPSISAKFIYVIFSAVFFIIIAFIYDPSYFRKKQLVAFGGPYFRGAKYDIKVSTTALSDHHSSWHEQYLPLLQSGYETAAISAKQWLIL